MRALRGDGARPRRALDAVRHGLDGQTRSPAREHARGAFQQPSSSREGRRHAGKERSAADKRGHPRRLERRPVSHSPRLSRQYSSPRGQGRGPGRRERVHDRKDGRHLRQGSRHDGKDSSSWPRRRDAPAERMAARTKRVPASAQTSCGSGAAARRCGEAEPCSGGACGRSVATSRRRAQASPRSRATDARSG